MGFVYLLFILSVLLIRTLAGYDSRFKKEKYFTVKNKLLRVILLDSGSLFERGKRPKKDINKLTVSGLILHILSAAVLTVIIIFLVMPDIPTEPWIIETEKFSISTVDLGEKISTILVFILIATVFLFAVQRIFFVSRENIKGKLYVFTFLCATLMTLLSLSIIAYFLYELILCFL